MLRMLCRSARNLSIKMYMLADDLGLIDVEAIYSNEMKRFCGKMSCVAGSSPLALGNVRRPMTDIMETDEAVIVTMELPGVKKEAVEITAIEDELSVRAKRTAEPDWDESAQKCDRSEDFFKRTIKLPCGIRREQAKAALKDGLLTITLPKETATIRTRINVE